MSNIICCTSTVSIGCTFLDWSINYLGGKTKFLSKQHGWIDLVSDPLTGTTAHQHLKNHPPGYKSTRECVEFLESESDYFSIYPFYQREDEAAAELNIDITQLTPEDLLAVNQKVTADYQQMIEYLYNKGAKIVYLELSDDYPLYFLEAREKTLMFIKTTLPVTQDQIRDRFDSLFFSDSRQRWQDQGLTAIWDTRERLALCTRPFSKQNLRVEIKQPILKVNALDLWYNGDQKILEIMDYCNIAICKDRMTQWLAVFDKWKNIQLKTLEFQLIYQDILHAIVNGKSMAIDLTFDQEIVIQHCLIYQHNLNLKTWGLEKFPKDTLDLHKLLEPNIHSVEKIY